MVTTIGIAVVNVGGQMIELQVLDYIQTKSWAKSKGEDSELFKQLQTAQQLLVGLNNKRKWEIENERKK